VLNNNIEAVVSKVSKTPDDISDDETKSIVEKLCDKYFDVRATGAVLATGLLKGQTYAQVRGPLQVSFSRSIDPVQIIPITMTRGCVTNDKEIVRGKEVDNDKGRTMGSKTIVPYGCYVCKISINAGDAARTGFDEKDLDLTLKALTMMFDQDKSAARSQMAAQKLFVFKHSSSLGEAPSNKLFEAIKITKKPEVKFPRSFSDYTVTVDSDTLKKWSGVDLIEKL
jgi:CRISPR-associated protein Csd2